MTAQYHHDDGVLYYDHGKFRMSRAAALVVLEDWRNEYARAFTAGDRAGASEAINASNELAAALEQQARWAKKE